MTEANLDILEKAVDAIVARIKERQPDRADWELFRETLLVEVLKHREEILAPQTALNPPG